MDNCLASAVEYAARGWSVFPCDLRGKEPRTQGRHRMKWQPYQVKQANESQICKWFGRPANLAIICGDVSDGLVVRDFDDSVSYRRWSSDHRDLAERLPTVATARGFHVYAKMAPCPGIRKLGDGELRGNGSYVLAPPSIHPSGTVYRWVVPLHLDAILPVISHSDLDLTEEDRRPTEGSQKQTEEDRRLLKSTEAINRGSDIEERYAAAINASLPTSEGQRHKSLFRLARRMLAIHRDGVPPIEVLTRVFDAWWTKALPVIQTKDKAQSLMEFLTAIKRAKVPLEDIVFECLSRAGMNSKPEWSIEFGEGVALLAGLCRELQRFNGSDPFYVSCRQAGQAIGVSHTVASNYLQLFVALGKLVVVEKGKAGGNRASRYRYIADDLFA